MINKGAKEVKETVQEPAKVETVRPNIMTKPLPQILDELANYIERVEEAVRQAKVAAAESREAAAQAKLAGEKAAEAARKASETAVAQVKDDLTKALNAMGVRVTTLETEMTQLKENASLEAQSLDKAFDALKARHMEDSPFMRSKKQGVK